MTKYFFIVAIILLLFSGTECKKEPPVIPPPPPTTCEYAAGNRSFSWRSDTVAWWPSTLGGVWAFSDTDAYLMGYIGEGKPPWRIFVGKHWNGTTWDTNINGTVDEIKHVANDVTGDDHYMVSVGNWAINPSKPGIGEFDNRTKKWTGYQFQTSGELRAVWTDGNGYFIAVGDSGMVYTKDGYSTGWVYSKAPTDYSFHKLSGLAKSEIYIMGYKSISGTTYSQLWKLGGSLWTKFLDNFDTSTAIIKIPGDQYTFGDVYANRCSINDSLQLYVVGWESYLFEAQGASSKFKLTNLSSLGLPLRSLGQTALRINGFSPKDYWVSGLRYHLYHWNGTDFQKIEPHSSLPYGTLWGEFSKVRRSPSGKTWMILEMSSQVYAVLQATP